MVTKCWLVITKYNLLFALFMGVILSASGYEWEGVGIFHKLVMLFCGIGIYNVGYRVGSFEMCERIKELIATQVINTIKSDEDEDEDGKDESDERRM